MSSPFTTSDDYKATEELCKILPQTIAFFCCCWNCSNLEKLSKVSVTVEIIPSLRSTTLEFSPDLMTIFSQMWPTFSSLFDVVQSTVDTEFELFHDYTFTQPGLHEILTNWRVEMESYSREPGRHRYSEFISFNISLNVFLINVCLLSQVHGDRELWLRGNWKNHEVLWNKLHHWKRLSL